MKRIASLVVATASLLTAVSYSSTITLNGTTYALTRGVYGGFANWDDAVQAEFGAGSSVSDFSTLKIDAAQDADALWDFLTNELGPGGSAYIEYNGQKLYQGMPMFFQLHSTNPGGGWFVINNIDPSPAGYPDRINLGRWDLGNQKIFAVVNTEAIPEPSSLLLGATGVLSLVCLRRRG